MTALQCENALLRQRVDSGFEMAQTQLALTEEKLRREFHDGLRGLEQTLSTKIEGEVRGMESRMSGEVQSLSTRLDRQDTRLDRLDAKIDQLAKWMIATQLTTMALIVGIAIQLLLR